MSYEYTEDKTEAELHEDLVEFRGWLAGYADLLREEADDQENRARRDLLARITDEFDSRVGYVD